ncbi:MAG: L-serine ammonia-lyase, iron-sulfur-dependent, subunit alpha [Spirochaetia bacterium]|nr:L-serine ammonia-lyase, iron-sulfur-dependent, subunit alpha [Spirochaetia bacterium]
MESIRELFRIGHGPSSSHTMGPRSAAERFYADHPDAAAFRATLYGSLAATGRGHFTDRAIMDAFGVKPVDIVWKPEESLPYHPNALKLEAISPTGIIQAEETIYSVGGGKVVREGQYLMKAADTYALSSLSDILAYVDMHSQMFWEYVQDCEGPDIWDFLSEIWKTMKTSVERGIETEGVLPGDLRLQRKASSYHVRANGFRGSLKRRSLLYAYALAVAEENAAGNVIVTAPTCGSCGVLPGVLYNLAANYGFADTKILRALATAGLIGTLVKHNASISGAQVGCQGEIGTACSMAAAAAAQLFGGSPAQIEYAAEMGLEHHLGLTCDPIGGYVQIPCIERNAFAASRALDANTYALLSDGRHRISFDFIVDTMNRTGKDLPRIYKETSLGGLALAPGAQRYRPH